MTRKFLLAATALAAFAIGGVALANNDYGHRGMSGPNGHAGMMMKDGSGPMGNMGGMMGMMQDMHGGMMGGMSPMGGGMMQMLDFDGPLTPDEMRAQLQDQLAEFDSDGDGTLSIAEFEALHSAMIREMMVDRFQYLDADGDGAVTSDEMTAMADRMERMWEMHDGMGAMQPGDRPGMGADDMMNDN